MSHYRLRCKGDRKCWTVSLVLLNITCQPELATSCFNSLPCSHNSLSVFCKLLCSMQPQRRLQKQHLVFQSNGSALSSRTAEFTNFGAMSWLAIFSRSLSIISCCQLHHLFASLVLYPITTMLCLYQYHFCHLNTPRHSLLFSPTFNIPHLLLPNILTHSNFFCLWFNFPASDVFSHCAETMKCADKTCFFKLLYVTMV